ncbi:MAG: beta-Ala-His dipeptidase [Candidatus Eisenbacteria bacterium]|nr:beta-Ala-His dipeptidase [Candidatus Latescibacterota bacterium]MBD3301166.1 beta-Ala-His dipeptidase [Candidatus Eisenbacteria bacterium]
MNGIESLEPKSVWRIFGEISKVPRDSGKEEAVMEMLAEWARARGLSSKRDAVGNQLIEIPATKGREDVAPIVIQGHVDMVCEKNRDTDHDFTRDPIRPKIEGDWVTAEGTTLGADNGIGVAMGLALAEEPDLVHGPVEVLLTVDEETGLTGATKMTEGFFRSKRMINLDSEEDTGIFIGCAGGRDSLLTLPLRRTEVPKDGAVKRVSVRGLVGGHSGQDINRNRGNAVRILARLLHAASERVEVRIASIEGGSKRNAIAREAFAVVVVPSDPAQPFEAAVRETAEAIREQELNEEDRGMDVGVAAAESDSCFGLEASRRILRLLLAVPHGVRAMSQAVPGLVETSSNLGVVATDGDRVKLTCCSRSSVMTSLEDLTVVHRCIAEQAGAEIEQPEGYPGWRPNLESDLLAVTRRQYRERFDREPELTAIHAGLECGLFTEKVPGLDIVSFGPDITGAHSPDERVSIPSVQRIWKLFTGVLEELATR